MRNESSRQMVARVHAAQEQPFIWDVDISGLKIHESVKQLIINCYLKNIPFALQEEDGENVVYYLPEAKCAVWCDNGGATLNTFQSPKEYQDSIKIALVAHRKFLSLRQIEGHEMYKEIVEQLKSI